MTDEREAWKRFKKFLEEEKKEKKRDYPAWSRKNKKYVRDSRRWQKEIADAWARN